MQAGNQTASQYAQPGLRAWLEKRPREQWPKLVRGGVSWGTERMMEECRKRGLPYLFKVRRTTKVKRHLEELFGRQDWTEAGQGWQGLSSELQLTGWSRKRRVVVPRRRAVRESPALGRGATDSGQGLLFGTVEVSQAGELFEYAVLGVAQLYRGRGEAENVFDELKNQWGWTGFTARDHQRCQIMARIIAFGPGGPHQNSNLPPIWTRLGGNVATARPKNGEVSAPAKFW
ncbi:MAG: hypothetical protein C0504_12535 [Candidatus Solibacter sp.]|nr:hypothetical protein [Candidatus Solibacter sp.]